MIIEDRIYDVECDCCHKSMNIFPIFLISDAEEIAKDKGWIVTDDNCHYCPNCWHYDDHGNMKQFNLEE